MSIKKSGIKLGMFIFVIALVAGMTFNFSIEVVQAEEVWEPARPINAVIQYAPGGGTDRTLRTLAAELEPLLGTDITASNMEGAAGAVATDYVRSAPADGYTWLGAATNDVITYRVMDQVDTTIDEWHFFVGTQSTSTITVSYDSEYETMDDLISALEENPGEVQLGTAGVGASAHLAGETLSIAGLDYDHITYDGGHPALTANVQDEVDFTAQHPIEIVDFLEADDLRALAVFDNEPIDIPGQGEVPPITDYLPELEDYVPQGAYFGILLYEDVPDNIVNTIEDAFMEVITSEFMEEYAADMGVELLELTGEEAREWHREQEKFMSWILYEAGAAPISPEEFDIERPPGF